MYTETESETIYGKVTKVEKRNRYGTRLNPKCLKQWMFSRENSKSFIDKNNFQRLADCVGVSM